MQAQKSTKPNVFGERLRLLRGSYTQSEFAEKIGITRSALANYETGRTNAKAKVIRQIAVKLDVSEGFLQGNDVLPSDLAKTLGIADDFSQSITKDEQAILRMLRLCRNRSVRAIVAIIIQNIIEDKSSTNDADLLLLEEDLLRLYSIMKADGLYNRGISRDTLELLYQEIAAAVKEP